MTDFVPKILVAGEAPTALAAVYTVPAVHEAYVRLWSVANRSATSTAVLAWVKKGAADERLLGRAALEGAGAGSAGGRADLVDDGSPVLLEAGDSLMLEAANTGVDYIIAGVERDLTP